MRQRSMTMAHLLDGVRAVLPVTLILSVDLQVLCTFAEMVAKQIGRLDPSWKGADPFQLLRLLHARWPERGRTPQMHLCNMWRN